LSVEARADFSSLTGTAVVTYGGLGIVRAMEFALTTTVSVTSIRVDGLPTGHEATGVLWHKTGAVNLSVTDTFPLGSPYSPDEASAGSATFRFTPALSLAPGTHSLVIMVEDTSVGGEWSVRQHVNDGGQFLTAGGVTFESIWGWYGNVDTDTNTASSVSIYDSLYFRIPRLTLTF
jgi:hypothetical protein